MTFDGVRAKLAGVLETPDREPTAYAIFAHCFTCSKDFKAAVRISTRCAEAGSPSFASTSTGLGDSEGDFAETNLSSNVDDVVAAAAYLDLSHGPASLMVGHSLGGAASSQRRTGCRRFARSRPSQRLLALSTCRRPCCARRRSWPRGKNPRSTSLVGAYACGVQLLDDLREHNIRDCLLRLERALMIFHSPVDTVVGIDQAALLFKSARHPKSFVSLDQADHLLLKDPRDAQYVGEVLAAWASRYVSNR